jgi:hypothetical protein
MQRAQIAVMKMGGRGDLDVFGAGTNLGSIPSPDPRRQGDIRISNRSTTK